jgi:hypothetical protein
MELTQHQRKLFGGLSDSQLNLLLRLVETVHEMTYGSVTVTIHAGKVVEIQKMERIRFQNEIVTGVPTTGTLK